MGKKLYPADTLKQAQSILVAWDLIDPALVVGSIIPQALVAEVDRAGEFKQKIFRLERELMDLRNQRDEACIGIWDMVKRTRASVWGAYGDDSSQYKLAGGTPISEKKHYRRKISPEPI